MKIHLVAIRDIKTNMFSNPSAVSSLGGAIRDFGDQCRSENKQDLIAKHPEDFELYQLGEYDNESGKLTNDLKQIAVGSNYRTELN